MPKLPAVLLSCMLSSAMLKKGLSTIQRPWPLKPWPEVAFAKTSSRLVAVRPESAFGPGTGVFDGEGVVLRLGVVVGVAESDGVVEGVSEAEGGGVFDGLTP